MQYNKSLRQKQLFKCLNRRRKEFFCLNKTNIIFWTKIGLYKFWCALKDQQQDLMCIWLDFLFTLMIHKMVAFSKFISFILMTQSVIIIFINSNIMGQKHTRVLIDFDSWFHITADLFSASSSLFSCNIYTFTFSK